MHCRGLSAFIGVARDGETGEVRGLEGFNRVSSLIIGEVFVVFYQGAGMLA
jgi:hypothetical protein